ncbi:hypothetical protein D3C84_782720 [compost metagenome]
MTAASDPLRVKLTTPVSANPLNCVLVEAVALTPVSVVTPLMAAAISRAEPLIATSVAVPFCPSGPVITKSPASIAGNPLTGAVPRAVPITALPVTVPDDLMV